MELSKELTEVQAQNIAKDVAEYLGSLAYDIESGEDWSLGKEWGPTYIKFKFQIRGIGDFQKKAFNIQDPDLTILFKDENTAKLVLTISGKTILSMQFPDGFVEEAPYAKYTKVAYESKKTRGTGVYLNQIKEARNPFLPEVTKIIRQVAAEYHDNKIAAVADTCEYYNSDRNTVALDISGLTEEQVQQIEDAMTEEGAYQGEDWYTRVHRSKNLMTVKVH